LLSLNLFAQKNWKAYTNTTHIYDVTNYENKIYLATWGGILSYDLINNTFQDNFTTASGFKENDIRAIEFLQNSEQLLCASRNNGIERIINKKLDIPISITDKINKIISRDSLIFVATDEGIGVYSKISEWPIPILTKRISIENGLTYNNITSIEISGNDYLLCGSDNGLDFAHLDSLESAANWHHLGENELPGFKINSISANNNFICLATDYGIIRIDDIFNNSNWSFFEDGNSIYPVYIDSNDDIYYGFGYWDEQYLRIQNQTTDNIGRISLLGVISYWDSDEILNDISCFKEIDERIFAFSWGEGFYFLENDHWQNIISNSIISSVGTTDSSITVDT
jgi:hypothetical protein